MIMLFSFAFKRCGCVHLVNNNGVHKLNVRSFNMLKKFHFNVCDFKATLLFK